RGIEPVAGRHAFRDRVGRLRRVLARVPGEDRGEDGTAVLLLEELHRGAVPSLRRDVGRVAPAPTLREVLLRDASGRRPDPAVEPDREVELPDRGRLVALPALAEPAREIPRPLDGAGQVAVLAEVLARVEHLLLRHRRVGG